MKKLVIVNLFILFSIICNSQISYEKRLEIELHDDYFGEETFEFGKMGFIMSSRGDEKVNNQSEWKYDLYSTELELQKTEKVLLNKKYGLDETFKTDESLHTLYKDRKGNYAIVSVDVANFKITQVEGKVPKKSWIKDMAILGDYAYFNALMKKEPVLLSVNWKTGVQKYIPVYLDRTSSRKISLLGFQVLEESNEVFVYIKVRIGRRETDMHIIRLNNKGEKKDVFNLTKNIDKNIVDVTASEIGNGKYIFTGTYSSKFTAASEGLYFCRAQDSKIDFIQFYNFLDLENFLTYLPERTQEKIERKKQRKENRGKEMKINYHIAGHEIIQLDDGYIFLGEAYYPTYRTETYTTYVNGVATTTTRTVFDGYQYTHAVLARFDKSGNLLWDQTFEMWPSYKPYYIRRWISMPEVNKDDIKLMFINRNKVVSKSFDFDGRILSDRESDEIETGFEGDKSKNAYNTSVEHWYDNYFLAWGTQKIKNKKDEDVKRKRKVYFVSKVRFE